MLMEPLTNLVNVQYLGSVCLGSPCQEVTVVFDTGSSDLWISEVAFQQQLSRSLGCPSADQCEEAVTIHYSVGTVMGLLRTDRLAIKTWSVDSQVFVLASSTAGLGNAHFQGVLGLAFPVLSHAPGTTVLSHLTGDAGVFSFLLANEEKTSAFILGLPPNASFHADTLAFAPVAMQAWWTFLGSIVIGSTTLCEDSLFALDTGTSYLSVPQSYFAALLETLLPPGQLEQCGREPITKQYVCPCQCTHRANVIYVTMGGKRFPIFPEDLFSRMGESSSCVLEVQPSPDAMPFILGDTFLRTVAAIFDVGRLQVGLARRVDHRASSATTRQRLEEDESRPATGPLMPPHRVTLGSWIPPLWALFFAVLAGLGVGCTFGAALPRLCPGRPPGYRPLH